MGTRGQTPKRSEQRRRTNEPELPIVKAEGAQLVDRPPAEETWHPIARRWFESLAESGQSRFFEPSDWATAAAVAENLSRELKPKVVGTDAEGAPVIMPAPLNGAAMSAFLKACTVLLATEGDRRRMQIELQRPDAENTASTPGVANLDDYRSQFAAG